VALACVLAAGNAAAQENAGEAPATFRSAANLVALNVVVTDARQRVVNGLSSRDFTVLEDDVPQQLSFFATRDIPLDLALLLDTSASMADKMPIVQEAAANFLKALRPGDRVTIVDIKNATKTLYPLGPDAHAAMAAVRGTKPGGGTGLFNGLYTTLKELARAQRGADGVRRQAIVVLSDGIDTASLVGFDDVMEVAKQAGVATYTITIRSRFGLQARGIQASSPSEYAMKTLAEETGGRAFFPLVLADLASVYDSIAYELANQYALAYTPSTDGADGVFRRIVVQVIDRPGVRTRTRSGYTWRRSRTGT
jgi:VWFA-related protein